MPKQRGRGDDGRPISHMNAAHLCLFSGCCEGWRPVLNCAGGLLPSQCLSLQDAKNATLAYEFSRSADAFPKTQISCTWNADWQIVWRGDGGMTTSKRLKTNGRCR